MKALLLLLVLALFPFSVLAEDSSCRNIENDCEYYSCVSEAKHCRDSSYLLRFGNKYCLRYENRRHSFSDNGIKWIDDVRSCLIRHMNTYSDSVSCKDFKKLAFDDHVPCYLESGFCELSSSDRVEILKTIWPSLGHLKIVSNGYRVFKACSNTKLFTSF